VSRADVWARPQPHPPPLDQERAREALEALRDHADPWGVLAQAKACAAALHAYHDRQVPPSSPILRCSGLLLPF